ncbi:unnamed protein product [Mucor hiemalis]
MDYDPSHKTSSVTSTSSSSSTWEPLPPLYTGRADSVSSAFELDDLQEPEPFEVNLLLPPPPPTFEAKNEVMEGEQFSEFLNSFFKEDIVKEEVIDHEVPSSNLCHGNSRKRSRQEEEEQKNRELLSDDQKRANHIASEQKRRNTIRGGFKELTEIIPTLKNINNSKSTILFKSVDYIKQLDKRNKSLRDRLAHLQARAQQRQQKKQEKQFNANLPPNAVAALLVHKNQQKQLELLQQQLRVQQALLTKHNIPLYSTGYHSSISIPAMDDTPVTSTTTSPTLPHASLPSVNIQHYHQHQQQHLNHSHKNTFSSSTSTATISSTTPAALVMPADEYACAPSFNIPADEHDQQKNSFRERLLMSGKLNHLRKDSTSFML